jgi:hypothetical protein
MIPTANQWLIAAHVSEGNSAEELQRLRRIAADVARGTWGGVSADAPGLEAGCD